MSVTTVKTNKPDRQTSVGKTSEGKKAAAAKVYYAAIPHDARVRMEMLTNAK